MDRLFKLEIGKRHIKLGKLLLGILVVVLLFAITKEVTAFTGLGGFFSEKVVSRQGVTNGSLVVSREGVSGDITLGMSPRGTETLSAINISHALPTRATLRGTITSLNGFPNADYWWEWGYNTSLGNTVGVGSTAVVGEQSFELTGFNAGTIIYYRFVTGTDGVAYGGILSVVATSTTQQGLANVLPYVFLGISLVMVVGLTVAGMPLIYSIIMGAIIAILGTVGTQVIVSVIGSW